MNRLFVITTTLLCVAFAQSNADAQIFRRYKAKTRVCAPRCVPQVCTTSNAACYDPCSQPVTACNPCATSLDCSFSGTVERCGADVCIRGKVRCAGMECRINSRIRSGCATIDCGDLQVRACIDGSQVCFEARARVCVPYPCNCRPCTSGICCDTCHSCHWSGWNNIICLGF